MAIRLTTEEFISKANSIHKGKYNYSNAIYTNSHTKISITCPTHGDFLMKPNNHLSGKQTCPTCAALTAGSKLAKSQSEFIQEMTDKHGNDFDLTEVTYKNNHTPVIVTHSCGHKYKTTPATLLKAVTCPKCSVEKLIQTTKGRSKDLASTIQDRLPDYKILTPYTTARDKLTVTHICGTTFDATPDNLLRNNGCPGCAEHGFNVNKPAILYYLSLHNDSFFKIGITNRSVEERFKASDLVNIKILNTWYYQEGKDAYIKEQDILTKFADYRTTNTDIISSGYTELFTTNILSLGLLNEDYFT